MGDPARALGLLPGKTVSELLLFRIDFPTIFYIPELVSNYFLGYVISCVVASMPCGHRIALHNAFQNKLAAM